jgi:hypothetical protein
VAALGAVGAVRADYKTRRTSSGSAKKGGGYTVRRPGGGPNDDDIKLLINIQQEGEIAFQLRALAQTEVLGRSALLESRTYEA